MLMTFIALIIVIANLAAMTPEMTMIETYYHTVLNPKTWKP